MTVRRARRAARRIVPALVASLLAAGTLAAASAPAHPHVLRHAAARQAGLDGQLTAAQAMTQARASGRPVTASALTTPTSVTVAHPGGQYSVTESAAPVRARRGGRWVDLNPALHRNANGTVSPAVTSSPLVLSGGGSGPLAVMTTDARTLTLSWPGGSLPTPTISGATATYSDVYPGVDLAVTTDAQGGFSEVLIVKNASAAANPALSSIKFTATAPGLNLYTDNGGNLRVAPSAQAVPVFTAGTPFVWDSAPPPAGMPTTTSPDGTLVSAQSGMPADSSSSAPGAGAHTATAGVSASGSTITLSPPASALTGSSTVYPVYIDPTWWPAGASNSAWTQVDKGYATTSYWKESSDLQSGYCGFAGCNNVRVARSFIRLPVPSQLSTDSVIHSAWLYTTEVWAPSCTAKSVRLYTTGGISSSTTWNNQPSWSSDFLYQDAAHGYNSSCPAQGDNVNWEVSSTIKSDVGSKTSQTWGIRAADETEVSTNLGWKQFLPGSTSKNNPPHMTVFYNDPPNRPSARSTNPGGSCQYSASKAPVIGNDDVTFSASVLDGDNKGESLTTRFLILNSSNATVYDSDAKGTNYISGNNTTAKITLTRPVMQGLQTNGETTAYTYHWYAMTTDQAGLTNSMPSDECYFTYNPNNPPAPTVTVPSTGQLGQQLTATIATTNCGTTSDPCPVSYTYQLGASPPVPVTIANNTNCTSTSTSVSCTLSIPVHRVGPMLLTVYGTASNGNLSEPDSESITGNPPAIPYADGDFNGDGEPDLLTPGPSTTTPGLWLATGTGNGALGGTTDIGGAGTGINPGSTDGPADWAGTSVLHGDFTGQQVQDVMAYYPPSPGTGTSGTNAGTAIIIAGTGDGSPLNPLSGSSWVLTAPFQDPVTGDYPTTLVAAGNASQASSGTADLIGITGDGNGNGYDLDLFTDTIGGGAFGYKFPQAQTLSAQTPDGAYNDWNNYTLATAQPGGDPSATVLFALNEQTGALYESSNPSKSASSIIGTPGSTWTQITVPWGSSPPAQLSGDVNHAGNIELWAVSSNGKSATAYTLTGTTLSQEAADSIAQPANDWPLAEGSGSGSTAADTIAGQNATLSSGASWVTGDASQFGNYITLDGSSGYLTPPSGTIPSTATKPKISLWFRTTTANGVLVGLSSSTLSQSSSANYDPVLYVGTDGHLYGEWWNGQSPASPAVSATQVDDGVWHHVVLTASSSSQTLFLDNQTGVTISGSVDISGQGGNLYFGAGFTGGNWPSEPNYKQTNAPDYFNGDIASIAYG